MTGQLAAPLHTSPVGDIAVLPPPAKRCPHDHLPQSEET